MQGGQEEHIEFTFLTAIDIVSTVEKLEIVNFVQENVRHYPGTRNDIIRSLDYALSSYPHQGGIVVIARAGGELIGAVIVNKTLMEGYVPENLIAYFATVPGLPPGIEQKIAASAVGRMNGNVAIHMTNEGKLMNLFEDIGFTRHLYEMRLR